MPLQAAVRFRTAPSHVPARGRFLKPHRRRSPFQFSGWARFANSQEKYERRPCGRLSARRSRIQATISPRPTTIWVTPSRFGQARRKPWTCYERASRPSSRNYFRAHKHRGCPALKDHGRSMRPWECCDAPSPLKNGLPPAPTPFWVTPPPKTRASSTSLWLC